MRYLVSWEDIASNGCVSWLVREYVELANLADALDAVGKALSEGRTDVRVQPL